MPMKGPWRTMETAKIAEFGEGDLLISNEEDVICVYELGEGVSPFVPGTEVLRSQVNPLYHIRMKFRAIASIDVLIAQAIRTKGFLLNRHWFENE